MKTTYTIGQVSKLLDLSNSTIRYYDNEKLLPNLTKNDAGIRSFTQADIDTLRVIECLKKSGMKIKDIYTFTNLVAQGDSTIKERRDMFYQIRHDFTEQMEAMKRTMEIINFKCDYYDKAINDGTEKYAQAEMPLSEIVPVKVAEK
ncbi:MerR family transcriptional regulator [Companilactobacillus kimchiensis]|uniref:Transcriptional regulator n=1 Tax=Companilactobacillus kimchiensis TaxID=993692 RepID=A0A0R2LMR4_9LACO|nr:MerR family transcriptional regulator [Companilactobacillus kimchiensis]KRO00704.1 transcriptional regulator [Companilactobacillus kimchiensis]